MTLREHPEPALDTNDLHHRHDPPEDTDLALAEAAEAEAEAVEARAAAARARAIRLRRQSEAPPPDRSENTDTADSIRRQWVRRPGTKAVAIGAAIMLLCASLAASGYFVWQDRIAAQKRQRTAEFAAAARQDVVALMSLDFSKSHEDMQHIAENSTGNFKQHFPLFEKQLTNGLERSKIVTTVTVNDVAVESMTEKSAVVLVAATTEAKTAEAAPDAPRQSQTWRIVLTLQRDNGGQPKMSDVEFVQ
ncbi:hypothetical protein ACTXG5_11015 [Mycobacterium sp. Dal123C01]|uniref:hypothetical protein n=1 Tax=Mycobacterium sp. Dal123C01 TaxID=3457577 RepID=UPI00403EF030